MISLALWSIATGMGIVRISLSRFLFSASALAADCINHTTDPVLVGINMMIDYLRYFLSKYRQHQA